MSSCFLIQDSFQGSLEKFSEQYDYSVDKGAFCVSTTSLELMAEPALCGLRPLAIECFFRLWPKPSDSCLQN